MSQLSKWELFFLISCMLHNNIGDSLHSNVQKKLHFLLQSRKSWNIIHKFRNLTCESVLLLTQVREILRISYYRKLKNIMLYSFEKQVFLALESYKIFWIPMNTRQKSQQNFNYKNCPGQKTILKQIGKFDRKRNVTDNLPWKVGCIWSIMTS